MKGAGERKWLLREGKRQESKEKRNMPSDCMEGKMERYKWREKT